MKVLNFYACGCKIPEGAVYIGRANLKYALKESFFKNPFRITKKYSRERVIELYENRLRSLLNKGIITKEKLLSLDGQDLVCYCAPKACHGDVLVKIINEIKGENHEQQF